MPELRDSNLSGQFISERGVSFQSSASLILWNQVLLRSIGFHLAVSCLFSQGLVSSRGITPFLAGPRLFSRYHAFSRRTASHLTASFSIRTDPTRKTSNPACIYFRSVSGYCNYSNLPDAIKLHDRQPHVNEQVNPGIKAGCRGEKCGAGLLYARSHVTSLSNAQNTKRGS